MKKNDRFDKLYLLFFLLLCVIYVIHMVEVDITLIRNKYSTKTSMKLDYVVQSRVLNWQNIDVKCRFCIICIVRAAELVISDSISIIHHENWSLNFLSDWDLLSPSLHPESPVSVQRVDNSFYHFPFRNRSIYFKFQTCYMFNVWFKC